MMRRRTTMILMSLIILSGASRAQSEKDWTGFYGGLNAGVNINHAAISANNLGFTNANGTCNTNADFTSLSPGLQIGYARELINKVVLGVEADYNYNFNKQGNADCTCDINTYVSDRFTTINQQQGSLRGRIGYAIDYQLLPYFIVGEGLANVAMNYRNEVGDYYSNNTSTFGWLLGAGLEWHVTHAWSIRAEYSYTAYNNAVKIKIPMTYGLNDPNGHAHVDLHVNALSIAFNYWLSP